MFSYGTSFVEHWLESSSQEVVQMGMYRRLSVVHAR